MREIRDFVGAHPPFKGLGADELDQLAGSVDVRFHMAGDQVVEAGQPSSGIALLVRAGRLEVIGASGSVIDEVDPGSILGEDRVRDGLAYLSGARAAEDTLVYHVPLPESLRTGRLTPLAQTVSLTRVERLFDAAQGGVTDSMRPLVINEAATPIADVAKAMAEARTSCSLITWPDGQIGVVTDSDMARKVATGVVPITAPVVRIATAPALTIDSGALLGEAYLAMVEAGVHHLVVLTPHGRPIGVIRALDVASDELRNPLVVRGVVERAQTAAELVAVGGLFTASIVELVDRNLPIDYVGRLQSGVVDAIVRRAVDLVPRSDDAPAGTWLVQGSTARREPLPGSDVDTAVSWSSGDPAEHLAHASRVLRLVERAGLATCRRGANADNSLFNRSEEQWRHGVRGWLDHEEVAGALALASIVADTRTVHGPPSPALLEAVGEAARHDGFMAVLARHTLGRRPPLGFVRDFVVESSGEHRGHLDLKRGGLIPVSSMARWLALRTGDVSGSTIDRLSRAAEAGFITADQRDMMSGAFRVVMTVLATQQVRAIKAGEEPGSFLRPEQLDPLERRQLREAFRAIAGVQSALSASQGVGWA